MRARARVARVVVGGLLVVAAFALLWFAGASRSTAQEGFLGIELAPLTRAAEARAPYVRSGGALIAKVVPNSPAALARLGPDEIVTAIDGVKVDSASAAAAMLAAKRPGQRVSIVYYDLVRGDGRRRQASAVLAPAPPVVASVFSVEPPRVLAREWNFRPSMAAGASWSNGIARGPVEPLADRKSVV